MARIDRHSRIVGWLKVALPLTALILLSTLFLLAERIDPSDAIRYAEVDVEALARDPRMTAPSYAGITSDGASLTLTAAAARPATAERTAAAETVHLRLEMPGGGDADLTAASAEIDTAAGELRLSGAVEITTSSGYRIETEALTAHLDRSGAESGTSVSASAPRTRIEAGTFRLSLGAPGKEDETAPAAEPEAEAEADQAGPSPSAEPFDSSGPPVSGAPGGTTAETGGSQGPSPYLLVFSGGVRMVYQPGG